MKKYNLIYTSPDHDRWLWNGKTFDKLANHGEEVLFFSGRSIAPATLKKP